MGPVNTANSSLSPPINVADHKLISSMHFQIRAVETDILESLSVTVNNKTLILVSSKLPPEQRQGRIEKERRKVEEQSGGFRPEEYIRIMGLN